MSSRDLTDPAVVAALSDAEVLQLSGNGKYGPGLIGKALADRSSKIIKATGGGAFGPAITDPNYADKQRALRERRAGDQDAAAEQALLDGTLPEADRRTLFEGPVDLANLHDPRNPWTYVTLSGAKVLAQTANISHVPRIKRADLIAELQAANVTPPPVPSDDDADGDA